MIKQEVKEMEKAVEAAKKAELPKELQQPEKQPLGFDFKQGGVVTLSRNDYLMLVNMLKPFQYLGNILDAAKDEAVRTGNIIPFYEKDVKEVQKNEAGQIVNYILNDDFGSEKKNNSVSLTDISGTPLTSKK